MIKLGQEARDKVTGFTGIAISEIEYLFGCTQFGLSSKMNEKGEIKDAEFFDEGRFDFIGEGVSEDGGIPNWSNDIKLGNEAKDRVTGFNGIVIGQVRNLFGDVRYGIAPNVSEGGEKKDVEWFNRGRVDFVGIGIAPEEVRAEKRGGISKDMPKGIR